MGSRYAKERKRKGNRGPIRGQKKKKKQHPINKKLLRIP
jgi:hypothetical protein